MGSETPSFDTVFCAAIEIASAEDRVAYIARAGGDDNALRGRVEKMVAAYFQAGSFLEAPPAPLPFPPAQEGPGGREDATIDEPIREGPGTVIGLYKLLEQIGEGG